MTKLDELAREIVESCVPSVRINDSDREMIARYRDQLLAIEDDLVQTFYDTLYAHEPTAAVFHDGERPAREQTLREWWRETVTGDLGDKYLEWMALVGIVHVRRRVENPMMLTVFQVARDVMSAKLFSQLPLPEAAALGKAISHLQVTVGSVIAEAYTRGYVGALENIAGLRPELSARMMAIEIKTIERDARASL